MSGFDAPYWNALQVLAWVYLGDRALVDLCAGGTGSAAGTYWADHKVLGEDGGLHSVLVETPGNPPNVRTLAIYAAALGRASTGSPGTEDAEREILHKLADGSLSVTGKQRGSRGRPEIAALAWCDLDIDYDKQSAVERVSRSEMYERLMFRREAVLKLWPDVLAVDEEQPIKNCELSPESTAVSERTVEASATEGLLVNGEATTPKLSGKKLVAALDEWANNSWGPEFIRLPGWQDLLGLARLEFKGSRITRDHARKLRGKHATEKAKTGGAPTHKPSANR